MCSEVIQKVVDTPAIALDQAVESSKKFSNQLQRQPQIKQATNYLKTLGPGLITGAADDDPSGIATYSQAGAKYGPQLLWMALFTFPLMAVVQEMCARIGLETGRGLAGNIRIHYPRWVLYSCTILLFIANTLNLGADLGAMAKSTQLIMPNLNFYLLVILFTMTSLLLQIYMPYKHFAKYLKLLVMALFSYVVAAFMIKLDWKDVLYHTIIPSITFSKDQLFLICGILGTTISPYLFFWQTSQEIEEEILKGKTSIKLRQGSSNHEIKNMREDVWSGMFISNLIAFFIIAATSGTLFANGLTNINTAADAAQALRPLAGNNAYLLFTLGIIGTGFLAVPILAGSASYALSEAFRWRSGLYRKLKEAPSFYGVIIISMLIGMAINFTNFNPIKALIYSAVLNGLIAPIILVLIVVISSNRKIMNQRANSSFINLIGWLTILIMAISGIAAIISLIST